jgi:predicted dehydrogenase
MKILVAGLGGIGQRHLRNLRTLLGPEAELSAYRVRGLAHALTDQLEIEPGADVAAKYGVEVFHDLAEALARRPDAAFICNPTSLHLPVALRAARAGCHLFLEKPLSHTLDGVDELLAAVAGQGLVTLVGYQLRFHPCLLRLRRWIQAGAVGRLLAVRAEVGEYLPGWHRYEDYRQMYAARADQGGGVVLSQIHELDYLGWIFGWPRRVFALGGRLSSLGIDVEDTASLLMETVVDGAAIPVHLHLDYVQRPPSRTCQVVGDAGKILVDLGAPCVLRYDAEGREAEREAFPAFQRNQLFLDEARHFLACVAGREAPAVPLAEGLRSLRVALAARASMAGGRVVDLGEEPC